MRNTLARLRWYGAMLGGLRVDGYTNAVHGRLVDLMLADIDPASVGVVCKLDFSL